LDNLDLILTVLVLLGAFGLFVSGKVRVDLVAICVLVALLTLGLITPEEGLRGFANPATVTIGAMFILGMWLVKAKPA
jgi:di/tricarboxylate transporter